ncbi:MAG: long-chain-fatty-acid--CoA ligase [Pseudomonadota bacterium]
MHVHSIEEIIRTFAATSGDKPIATYNDQTKTYREMDLRSNRVANALIAEGLRPDSRFAFIDKSGHAVFETLFGARKMGAVQIAVNWRLSPREMAHVINDSESEVVIVGSDFFRHIDEIAPELKNVRKIIAMGDHPEHVSYDDWLADKAATDPGHQSGPDDIALQLYTSGTTGLPKGTMLANANIFAFVESAEKAFKVNSDGVHLICVPLFHVGGIVWSLQAMAHGGHCIGTRDFDGPALIRAFPKYGVTHGMMVPAVIQMLLAVPEARTTDFSTLRGITYGGSAISEKVLADALNTFKCGLYGMYGSTELSFGITMLAPDEHDPVNKPEILTSCGKALPGTEMRIVDPASLEDVADEAIGEVWIRSPQVTRGYWKQPKSTADVFLKDGWYRTGDIGYIRNGYLFLHDRLKDMIVSGAENVYPAEVERVLAEHPGIAEAAVIGIPDEKWGESVKAIVVLAKGATLAGEDIIAYTRANLAHYKCPKSVDIVPSLPRTPSGKIVKHELREPFWAGRKRRVN